MKKFLKIINWLSYILFSPLLVVYVYKLYLKRSTKIKSSDGVSSLEPIVLGNMRQWIFIRSKNKEHPILIFLHGGPGAPLGGICGSRKHDKELLNHFTVVHWDQRGAGKSYNDDIPLNAFTYQRLVEDCIELIDYTLAKFNKQKVFLIGHSAGSVIGLKVAHQYPEKLYAYIGIGQIINDYEKERISYNYILEKATRSGNIKLENKIRQLGPPPYDSLEKEFKKANYIVKFGGFIYKNPILKLISAQLLFITSPDYTLVEGIRVFQNKGLKMIMPAMWEEIKSINFMDEIDSMDVPVYFFQGKHDMITPSSPIENFYKNLDTAKGKKIIFFENSAHVPFMEEKEKYDDLLINLVLQESL